MIKACKYEWERPSSSYLAWPTLYICVCVCVFVYAFCKTKCLMTLSLSSRLVRLYYDLLRSLNSNLFEVSCLTCKQWILRESWTMFFNAWWYASGFSAIFSTRERKVLESKCVLLWYIKHLCKTLMKKNMWIFLKF
jgi:hypothetical protein